MSRKTQIGHAYLSFEVAREYVKKLKLPSQQTWRVWARSSARPQGIPKYPDVTYGKEGWISWGDWLGNGNLGKKNRRFLPFTRARAYARRLGLKSWREWKKWSAEGHRPENIPVNPAEIYPDQWVSVADWLGYKGRFVKARFISGASPAERTIQRRRANERMRKEPQ